MSTCFLSEVITMSEQIVPSSVTQRVIVKFLTNENVKAAEILMRLRAQFSYGEFSRTQVCDWSKSLKKAEQRLKTCENHFACWLHFSMSYFSTYSAYFVMSWCNGPQISCFRQNEMFSVEFWGILALTHHMTDAYSGCIWSMQIHRFSRLRWSIS
jgi:hypothetical protein